MLNDAEIAELLQRAAADLHPAVEVLVSRAERQGRRRRRWRIAGIAGGNALAVTAVAALAYTTASHQPSLPARPVPGLTAGASSSSRPAPRPSPSPGTTPSPGKSAPSQHPMTQRQMLSLLRSMLPAGSSLSIVPPPYGATGPGSLEVDYNDGQGKAAIILDVTAFTKVSTTPTSSAVIPLTCPHPLWTNEGTRPAGALPISCQVRHVPGIGLERDAVMYADSFGFYGINIYLYRADHTEVFIQVGNGYPDPALPHVDRARPPGSMALWEAVVQNPAWHA
jgi:hypothetical protein